MLYYWWGICWCGVDCIVYGWFIILVVGVNGCGIFIMYCLLVFELVFIGIGYGGWGFLIGCYWCLFILVVYWILFGLLG